MTTTFVFCRHGESEVNAANHREETSEANSPLTELGHKQSELLANSLISFITQPSYLNHSINILISNLDRAINTSKPFLQLLKTKQIDFTHQHRNEIIEYLGPHKIIGPELQQKGISKDESWSNFIDNRVFAFFEELKSYPPNSVNILFSHGYFLSALLSIIAVQGEYHGHQRVAFELENCSRTIVTFNHNTRWFKIHKVSEAIIQ